MYHKSTTSDLGVFKHLRNIFHNMARTKKMMMSLRMKDAMAVLGQKGPRFALLLTVKFVPEVRNWRNCCARTMGTKSRGRTTY